MKNWPKIALYSALVLGSLIFSFPFFWMILTSIKQQNEMTPTRMRLLPRAPAPVEQSPYVDASYYRPGLPEDMAAKAWDKVLPDLRAFFREKIEAWLLTESGQAPFSQYLPEQRDRLASALTDGLLQIFSERLSNQLREDSRRLDESFSGELFPTWKAAVVAEAGLVADPALMEKLSRECMRNVEMGKVRIQLRDGQSPTLNPQGTWTVAAGETEVLVQPTKSATAVAYQLGSGQSFRLVAHSDDAIFAADTLRSIFLGVKGDESWAQVEVTVDIAGHSYRAERKFYLWNSDWREEEFIFPQPGSVGLDSRSYQKLAETGESLVKGAQITVQITKLNWLEAWTAKILLNYQRAAGEVPLLRYFATSIALVLLNVLLMIFACTLTGYAFARLEWPGRDVFFGILLATMMIPAQVTMIPNFLVIRELGWFNTLLPLWVPAFFGAPYFIFLVRQFLKNIPKDLEEAARLDGCGFLRIYWHVMLPLVKPTVASIAIFTFIGSWNNFLGPLIYLNDDRLYPLALGLFRLNLSNGTEMGLLMAASFIMTLPVILIFFFLQRFFIQGLAMSGVKE